jgi:hypothetical protein
MQYHTIESYSKISGIGEQMLRKHCRRGTIDCEKLKTAGQGTWLIPDNAVIKYQRPRRKISSDYKH